jgi:ferredoxin-NADP reductase
LIPNPDTKELQQATFSMVSAPIPSNNSTIEIAVKATKYSPIQWLMEKAKEGDSILIGAEPTGSTFDFLSSHPTDPLVFIGAGIGITPILSITQYLESHPKSRIKPSTIGILHQARSSTEFLHWERLINFSKRTPRTKLAYLLSERANERELDRMDSELAQYTRIGTLPQFIADTRLDRNTNIILCGPVGFVSDTKRWLMTHQGIPEHKLHSD